MPLSEASICAGGNVVAKGVSVRISIEGGEEAARNLKRVGISIEDVMPAAVQAAAMVLRDLAADRAPGPEIEMEMTGKTEASVGPTREKWIYRFWEFGTQSGARVAKKGGVFTFMGEDGRLRRVKVINHPGLPAQPFLRPAFDEGQDEAKNQAGAVIWTRVEKEV